MCRSFVTVRPHVTSKKIKKIKSAKSLVTYLFCPYTTPRALLSYNGTEFRNYLLEEINKHFGVKYRFTVSYHPANSDFVECANRKIFEVLRAVVEET